MFRPRFLSTIIASILIAVALFVPGCRTIPGTSADVSTEPTDAALPDDPEVRSVHLPFGIPGNSATGEGHQLIVGPGSVLLYNNERGTVDWIAWRTTRSDLGASVPRPDFEIDRRLPGHFRKIAYYDYSGSGYDRGHMVPSADRFGDRELNRETFRMTNIVPQTGALNQYPWEKLESYVRSQARRRAGFDAYQIAGVYGVRSVIKGKLTAPTNCWKVVVFVPRGQAPELTHRSRLIAVDMPNIDGIERVPWERYKTSVRAIEERTGLDLFADLPRDLQDSVETRIEMESPRR